MEKETKIAINTFFNICHIKIKIRYLFLYGKVKIVILSICVVFSSIAIKKTFVVATVATKVIWFNRKNT